MYEHFIGPKIGKMKIKDIRKSTVLGLYNDLTRSSDIGKTMAINTLEVIHNVLRQVLQVAVDDDYIRKIRQRALCGKLRRQIITNVRNARH